MPLYKGLVLLLALALAGLLSHCAETEDPRLHRPLRDVGLVEEVLVEEAALALRPSQESNRLLSGWWPKRHQGAFLVTAFEALGDGASGARLELVHLVARPRTLALDLADDLVGDLAPGVRVEVKAAGRDLGSVALTDPLEIDLPADLPLGHVLVELRPRGGSLPVRDVRVRPASEAGEVRWLEDQALEQHGPSRVGFTRRVGPDEVLVGRFHPPPGAVTGQNFRICVERQDGSVITAFEWSASWMNRLRGRRDFEIPLGDPVGLVGIRLEAEGEGPAARWTDLALASGPVSTPDPVSMLEPAVEKPELVVLYVMDALRADAVAHLGGLPGTTPVIDRLAREGTTFRAHRSLAPNTLPSTKALLTGEAYVDRGGWKLPDEGVATLAEHWRRAGYRTGLFSGNAYVGPSYGVDRGFDHVVEVPVDESGSYNNNAERLHEAALAWLGSLAPGERALVYIHAIHPHNPYDPPDPWRSELTSGIASDIDGSTRTLLAVNRRRRDTSSGDRQRLRHLYAAALAYNDAQLGRFLEQAQGLYADQRLLVAVTSDHGEELFDHGGVLHGYTLYDEMIRIPLVIWSPGLVAPGESIGLTNTLDLHATLAELAGASVESLGEGRSLLPILFGQGEGAMDEGPHLAAAASVKGGIYSIQSRRWKLIWAPRTGLDWGLGGGLGRTRSTEYLFHLEADPAELRNRAGEGDLEVAWLRSRLWGWIAAKRASNEGDGEGVLDEPVIDEETRRRLEALGYVD